MNFSGAGKAGWDLFEIFSRINPHVQPGFISWLCFFLVFVFQVGMQNLTKMRKNDNI
jgi:hypothetical protein